MSVSTTSLNAPLTGNTPFLFAGSVTIDGNTGVVQPIALVDPDTGSLRFASISANGLKVDGSGAIQPVSGTVVLGGGNANIGSVGITSLPSIPAGSNNIGSVALSNGVAQNSSGNAQIIIADASAPINCNNTTQTLVAGVSGKSIYVCSYAFIADGTGTATFAYGATPTDLSGPLAVTAQTGLSVGSGIGIVLVVPAGEALKIVTTTQVSGHISYAQF